MKFWKILIALIFTIVLLVFARKTTTVKSVHKTVDRGGILIEHDTVPKRRGAGDVVIPVKVSGAEEVKLFYRIGKMEFRAVDMNLKEGERNLFVASIPHHKKGTRAWYYIEAQKQTKDGKIAVSLPDKNSPNFKPILLKFQGNVPPYIILSHIFCLFGAIFFSVLAAFSAVDLKKGKGTMNKSVAFSLVTFIFLFMGFFPLGWALNYYTFGVLWEAFPFGSDVTDNKGQIAFLSWLVTLFLVKGTVLRKNPSKNLVSAKGFSIAVIVSFMITIGMYLIPHSLIL
ncbi:MAG: hypothetical protein AMJ73_02330 [candidate division Zixibacteria bacterium SM1_73]|nr:MAG: hypothetical protein AMJ73_02330 [candidate division Zixibacteria bacterium SM1_73]